MAAITIRAQIRRQPSAQRIYTVVTGSSADAINRLVETTFRSAVQRAPYSHPYTVREDNRPSLRKNTHYKEFASPSNLRGAVGNKAPHAIIVHEGRGSVSGKPRLHWENDGGPYPGHWYPTSVRPASAQPWIVQAYNAARRIQNLENVRPMNETRRRV